MVGLPISSAFPAFFSPPPPPKAMLYASTMRFSPLLSLFALLFVSACRPADAPESNAAPASSSSVPMAAAVPVPSAAPSEPAPPPPPDAPPKPIAIASADLCPIGPPNTWNACADKKVELKGKNPDMVHQHPMLSGPSGPGMPPSHQAYLEMPQGTQVILVSKEAVNCKGPMRATGILRPIDLGGAPGTKESYKGWALYQATVVCE